MLDFLFRSRMFTPAFRLFAALAVFGLVGAFVSSLATDDQSLMNALVGPISLGWKGGVGNQTGYAVLVGLAAVSGFLAGVHVALRDADPEAEAEVVRTDSVPLTRAPSGVNFLPLVAAFGVGVLIISQLTSFWVALAGFGILAAVTFTWMLRAWAERATGDDEVNRRIYARFIEPLRVPVVAAVIIAFVVLSISRVLLAVSKTGAVAVFGVIGAVILLGMALIAARPQISKNALTILLFVGAVIVIGAGITAAVIGQRDIEKHGGEGHGGAGAHSGGPEEGGIGPIVVEPPAAGGVGS
jgi:hypothetical protein